jgi:CHAT domain/SIR2-like domain
MRKDAHLEIGLRWRAVEDVFDVSVEYDQPNDAEDRRDLGSTPVVIDTSRLAQLLTDGAAYGRELAERLFASPQIRRFYANAKQDTEQETDLRLHLRLLIDPNAPLRYHMLRWELLHDPDDDLPIALKRYILLSRYLSSSTWRGLSPPMRTDLRALVAIANPTDAASYGLAPVAVDVERDRARRALAGLGVARLVELVSDSDTRVTLNALLDVINEGIDVLYLVCHGRMDTETAWVYLQDPDGTVATCAADELVARLRELERRPMIALLSSCQSAGSGDHLSSSDEGALAALGPRLAEAGVAAVVAMQGNVTMATAGEFFDAFFASLAGNGVVDYAMAVARGKVRDRADWWVPVLFSRLKRGRAWYQPEFGAESAPWQALVSQIKNEHCTPVVGPGLSSRIIGTRQEVARRWVERWQMPLAPHNLDDLAKVAQYLKVFYAQGLLPTELKTCLIAEFREQHPTLISEELRESRDLEKMYEVAGEWLRQQPDDPYTALAALPLPIYITTGWNRLLEAALDEAGRTPIVEFFEWNRTRARRRARVREQPTVEHPLVYHLFGHFGDEESLVLSEDDYFQWLTAWIKQSSTIPDVVKTAMTRRSLLFLGYQLDDWDFRVVFQAIKSFEGSEQLRDNVHVGVQLNPESGMFEPEAAQDYLERFFDNDKVTIFWGETERFLSELARRRSSH